MSAAYALTTIVPTTAMMTFDALRMFSPGPDSSRRSVPRRDGSTGAASG
jgi:hypothetical protein